VKQVLFEIPIWKENIDISKIQLQSSNYQKSFFSEITTSHGGDNNLAEESCLYLSKVMTRLLSKDYKIKKLILTHIWRNIYKQNFQDRHNHAGSHFSFVIYEKLQKPQTVFFHPAADLMLTVKNNIIFKTSEKLNVVQNDLVIFPGYLDHMVCLTEDGLTISGNFDIEVKNET
jgi:hypothetical protein